MALQKKTRGVVRLYQGISEIVADIWRPTVKDGLAVLPGLLRCAPEPGDVLWCELVPDRRREGSGLALP